jgi:capsular polysaccharide transport system permease protein
MQVLKGTEMQTKISKFSTPRTIFALMVREMLTTNGRSPGGYLWAVAEPLAGIALLTVLFSFVFRSPPLGDNFAYFYATGVVPFMMYTDLNNKISLALNFSKSLLFYPRVTFVDALLARFILNSLTQILVFFLVFCFLILVFNLKPTLDFISIFKGIVMTAALGVGVGVFNCFMTLRFPVWQRVWTIFTRPLFLLSCVFFLFETVADSVRNILWYNPLVHVMGMIRRGFFNTYDAPYVSMTYVMLLSLVLTVFGLLFLSSYHRDWLNK